MDFYLERKSKRTRRACNQALLPGGMIKICLDYSYDNFPHTPTTYNPRFTLHWWDGVDLCASVLSCPT